MQVTLKRSPSHAAKMVPLNELARRGTPPGYLLAQDRVACGTRSCICSHAAELPCLPSAATLRPGQASDRGNAGSAAQSLRAEVMS